MAAGGYRKPGRPAAVSGPGALSQRTDGGPGAGQPIRVPSGGAYGERKAAEAQQAAAPMASGGPATGGGMPPAGGAPLQGLDVFGPTQRPNESPTAGIGGNDSLYSPDDPYMLIRIAYQMYPHPSLARLLPEE